MILLFFSWVKICFYSSDEHRRNASKSIWKLWLRCTQVSNSNSYCNWISIWKHSHKSDYCNTCLQRKHWIWLCMKQLNYIYYVSFNLDKLTDWLDYCDGFVMESIWFLPEPVIESTQIYQSTSTHCEPRFYLIWTLFCITFYNCYFYNVIREFLRENWVSPTL